MSARANLIGRTLADRFVVGAILGEGAMAAVYRGTQEAEPREVALKVMHAHLTTDRTFVARFKREARSAAQIDHPNSVRILDFGIDGHVVFIAMELLNGRDLFDTLAVEGPLPSARAARIMIQVADALAAAHARGIVHRDLKPENIMLVPDPSAPDGERVKVLDFGIAKLVERETPPSSDAPLSSMGAASLTMVGTLIGTPSYMSPEQCRGEPIDARSDVFSAGVVLYQMLTRRLPFDGESIFDVADQHAKKPPERPTRFVPTIDRGLERIVLRALATDPAGRPASAAELRDALADVLANRAPKASDAAAESAPPTGPSPPRAAPAATPIETLPAPAPALAAPRAPAPAPAPPAARRARSEPPPSSDGPQSFTRPSFVLPEEIAQLREEAARAAAERRSADSEDPGAEGAAAAPKELVPADAPPPAAALAPAPAPPPVRAPRFRWQAEMLPPVLVALAVGIVIGAGACALLR